MTDNRNTILIVDDERYNINVLNDLLKNDYNIMAAKSGEQALKAVEKGKPDLVLLDVMMPDMDGYEVCQKLKANGESKDIPIIFITALTDASEETKGFELGAVDFISKPFHNTVVIARVRMHLELVNSLCKLELKHKQLNEAMKVREDMESLMRHDLKAPLTPIIGLSQFMIEYGDVADENRENLLLIRDSGYRILNMINISTDMVKLEHGSYELNPMPFHLSQIIQGVCDELKNSLESKKIKLKFETPCDHIKIQCEELLVHSMFSNLVKNAIEASEENKDIVVTSTKLSDDTVKVSIENSGEVPIKIRDNFFDKYVTCDKKNGTGLGTYSAKLIATAHGGDIFLEDSISGKTVISVQMPIGKE